ncbi:MAG: Atu2307/SP_0267 family LLM class monooxygenase [Bacteroidota bacterium]
MEIGIDSFAGIDIQNITHLGQDSAKAMDQLLERMEYADEMGLDVFGIGQHYRKEFLDSANTHILAAAAARTKNIRLTSAVTVLSASDPVNVFQNFATLDLISQGRAEIVLGRGSFTDGFPLYGLNMEDYDELFIEKLALLLQIRENEVVNWEGKFRPALRNQAIYPRPLQDELPIWIGVGGTPGSFYRAGYLGMPLMVAVIGGQTARFRQLVDLYYEGAEKAGHDKSTLKVGLHSLGFVGNSSNEAVESYYPGYQEMFTRIGKERGWPPVTRGHFNAQSGPNGAIVVGDPEEVAKKIVRHSDALGGISRFCFQMDNAGLSHEQLKEAIRLIGQEVKPRVLEALKEKNPVS